MHEPPSATIARTHTHPRLSLRGAATALALVAASVVASVVASAVPAHAGPGASGVWYEVKTVCSTGSMTVRAHANTNLLTATSPVTFDVTTASGTTSHTVAPATITNVTVPGRIAMIAGVTVREGGVLVAEQPYAVSCPPVADPYEGISRFAPLSPRRVFDTRPDTLLNHTGAKPSSLQSIVVPLAGLYGIPADATAVVLNITATESEGAGYVQAFPTGRAQPGTSSNVNLERSGQTIPNAAIVKLGDGGAVTLFTTASTHLVLDVSGAFVPATPLMGGFVASEGRFKGIAPTRMLDTRPGSLIQYSGGKPAAGQIVEFSVAPMTQVPGITLPPTMPTPAHIGSVVLNVTATEASAAGYVQVAAGGALVPGQSSNLNLERAGQTIPNLVIVPVSADRTVSIFTNAGTHLVVDVLGFFTNDQTGVASVSGLFVPLAPERILDTRDGVRVDGGTYSGGPGATTVYVDRLPVSVGSVVLNVVATEAAGPGYVQVGPNLQPDGMALGEHSNLNVERAGQTIPNLVITQSNQLNVDGVTLFSSGGAQLIADIFGWFTYSNIG